MSETLEIVEDDLTGDAIIDLLATHLQTMHSVTPLESAHALDLDGLKQPDISFWSVWLGEDLVGCGALREMSATEGEIKSMHTAAAHRGKGIAEYMLQHILTTARARGYQRLYLETGAFEAFLPARKLYAKFGFQDCPPFGNYKPDPLSSFMTLAL